MFELKLLTNTARKSKERFLYLQLQLWFVLVFTWGLIAGKERGQKWNGGKISPELRYHSDLLLLANHQVEELYLWRVISVYLSCLGALCVNPRTSPKLRIAVRVCWTENLELCVGKEGKVTIGSC